MTADTQAEAVRPLDKKLVRIAIVVILGSFMSILDTTSINVAIRELSRDFGVSLTVTQWVSTGYMLALATVIPLSGWAADRFGTKRLFIVSILFFVLGAALCSTAWSATSLIVFRVLQGIGGGMIMPTGMTILAQAAGRDRVARMMGFIGVPLTLAPISGPILGGWFVEYLSWRWIFFVNVPIGAIALLAALWVLEPDESKPHHSLDWRGLLMLSPGLAIFVYGLSGMTKTAREGVKSINAIGGVVLGLLMLVAFVLHARRREGALIDVRIFFRRSVGSGALTNSLFAAAFFGASFLLPLYFQLVRGETAFHAGMLMAAEALGAIVSMPVATRITDRTGARPVVLAGLTLLAIGMLSLTRIQSDTPLWFIACTLFVMGLGKGATMMPSVSAALSTLQRHEIARVNSGVNMMQRVAASIGITLVTVVLSYQMAKIGQAVQTTDAFAPSMLPALARAFGNTFAWSLGITILAFAAATFLPRRQSTRTKEQ